MVQEMIFRYRIAGINRHGGHVAHRTTYNVDEVDALHDELMALPDVQSTMLLGAYPEADDAESVCAACGATA